MHGGEVPLVHGLDVGELVEVVGAERAQPGREVAEGAGRAAGRSGDCSRGRVLGQSHMLKELCSTQLSNPRTINLRYNKH